MNLFRVKTELSAQYVDHNLLQTDFKNPDDHRFLRSACKKFGLWYSRPGSGGTCIGDDDELLAKSLGISSGYWGDQKLTAMTIDSEDGSGRTANATTSSANRGSSVYRSHCSASA